MSPTMRPNTSIVRRGASSVLNQNNIPMLIAALPVIMDTSAEVGAQFTKKKAVEFAEKGGDWEPNAPDTLAWKAPETRPMHGRTGLLTQAIEIRSKHEDHPPPARGKQRLIGWFEQQHPDPQIRGDRHLTMAEIATVHEYGLESGGNLPGDSGGSLWDIPPRPYLSVVADRHGEEILMTTAAAALEQILAFNSIRSIQITRVRA